MKKLAFASVLILALVSGLALTSSNTRAPNNQAPTSCLGSLDDPACAAYTRLFDGAN
jgi:hypothetical protein